MYLNSILESKKKRQANQFLRNYRNKNEEFIFLKLTINIQLFDKIDLNDEDKEAIELIDFPGLNSGENNLFEKAILDPIIKFSNGFLFVSKPSINEDVISEIIESTIEKINKRKILDFSFDSFLFVLTHYEKISKLDLNSKKNEIKNIIYSGDLFNSQRFNETKFLITKFSNNFYQKYLEEQKYIINIVDLYSYLRKEINNIEIDNINYPKKLKKKFDDIYFKKLINQNDYSEFNPLDNEFKKCKDELMAEIKIKMTSEYEDILNEFIKKYLFYIKNYDKHKYCENSNLNDFKNNLKQLFENSKKSYNKTLEKSIISFLLYLQNKLDTINDSFIYKKVTKLIENKNNEEKKKEESYLLNETFDNSINVINQKISSFKNQFQIEISLLYEDVSQGRRLNEIEDFTSNWKERKESLENDIKNEINDLGLKVNEKISSDNMKENEFEKQEEIKYFNWKHITAHSIALTIHGGLGIAAIATSIAIPGIGFMIVGGGLLIHLGICGIKYLIDKKTELQNLLKSIIRYSESFNDSLNAYKNNILETLNNLKNSVIEQIHEKYSKNTLEFDKDDEKKFKEIIELFQQNLFENFNLK